MGVISKKLNLIFSAAIFIFLFVGVNAAFAYTLSGIIYGGSNPMSDATVNLYEATTGNQLQSTVTNTSGFYSFTVDNGTYNLLIIPPSGSGFDEAVVNGIPVNGGDVTQNVVLIQQAYTLSGVVRNLSGTPVSNIGVYVEDQASDVQVGYQLTDTSGSYSFPLAGGTYKIRVYRNPGNPTSNVPMPQEFEIRYIISNLAISSNTIQDITLPLVTLSGKTTDSNGVPVGGVTIKVPFKQWVQGGILYWCRNDFSPYIVSDASGNYLMGLLSYNDYSVTLIPPTGSGLAQTVVNGVNVITDTIRDFALSPPYILSGVVRNLSGTPVSNIGVYVEDQASDVQVGYQLTDTSGSYSFPLAGGTYKIRVYRNPGNPTSNVPMPQEFEIRYIISNLAISSNTIQDITLPLVTLSGKTTDSNGVPVGGVTIKVPFKQWVQGGILYWCRNDFSPYIVSDASGNYLMGLLPYANYSETIIPPTGSGFAQTVVNNVSVTHDILQNIILNMPDDDPPIILSGPTITSITCDSAVVEWQTNEGTKGGVKYGTSSPPGTTIAESNYYVLHSTPLIGLTSDTEYFVQVYGSDYYNNGPVYSDVVSFRTKLSCGDTTPPVFIEGPNVGHYACTGEVVTWRTDEPATGRVCYGQAEPLNDCINAPNLSMSYQVVLNGLQADTTYLMKVTVTDSSNNSTTSPIISFRTQAVYDTTPPVIIEGPMAIDISDTEATIIWRTDEPATNGVSYNDGTHYGVYTDNTLVTYHSVRLTGLTQSTTYNYTVSSKDACENGPTLSQTKQFKTTATPCKKPVIIEGPIVVNVTHQSAVIRWWTDVRANTIIEYGTTADLGETASRAALVRHHNLPITHLQEDTDYFYRVLSYNSCSNDPAVSDIYTFHTDNVPDCKKPVLIVDPHIIHKTDKTATVYWETDEPADTTVNYGEGSTLNQSISDGEKLNKHQVTITNLQEDSGYSHAITSTDLSGNTTTTSEAPEVFTTNPAPDTTTPVITEGPSVISRTDNMATIRWVTDEIADSKINYGLQGQPLNLSQGDITHEFEHIVVLTNLQSATAYSFQAASADSSGNSISSSVLNFSTEASPDTTGPVFTALPSATDITQTAALIQWDTDEPSTTQVKYGTSSDLLNSVIGFPGLSDTHDIVLTNLEPLTTYYFKAFSMDSSGNSSESTLRQFTTQAPPDTTSPTTTANPVGGTYTSPVSVTLTCDDHGGSGCDKTYYTTDGSNPTASSPVYAGPINIATTKTLKFFSVDMDGNQENVKTETYTINPPPSVVTVNLPNGGEIIPSGLTYNIQWSAPTNAVKFTLKYSLNNGSTWKLIAKNLPGPSYNWAVPCPNNNKVNNLVKVIGFNASGIKVGEDTSNATFKIEVVKVTSPNGEEILIPSQVRTISWQTNCTIRPVTSTKLFYSTNGGSTWKAIKTLTGNPGSYNWTVPNVSSGNCKVKAVLKDSYLVTIGSDISDGVFTIQP